MVLFGLVGVLQALLVGFATKTWIEETETWIEETETSVERSLPPTADLPPIRSTRPRLGKMLSTSRIVWAAALVQALVIAIGLLVFAMSARLARVISGGEKVPMPGGPPPDR